MTEPGQPCVMISGSAFSCGDRTWMKWMSTPSISVMNCGSAFSRRLALAPVVLGRPVARELLHRRQLHALRPILDELLGGPACRRDAAAQVVDLLLWNLDLERPNLVDVDGGAHSASLVFPSPDGLRLVTPRSLICLGGTSRPGNALVCRFAPWFPSGGLATLRTAYREPRYGSACGPRTSRRLKGMCQSLLLSGSGTNRGGEAPTPRAWGSRRGLRGRPGAGDPRPAWVNPILKRDGLTGVGPSRRFDSRYR